MIILWHQSGVMITIIYNLSLMWIILETRSGKHHLQQYLQLIKVRKFVKMVLHSRVDKNIYHGGASCAYLFIIFLLYFWLFRLFPWTLQSRLCWFKAQTVLVLNPPNTSKHTGLFEWKIGPIKWMNSSLLFTKSMHTHAHALSQRCNCFNEEIHQRAKRALQHKLLMWRQTSLL